MQVNDNVVSGTTVTTQTTSLTMTPSPETTSSPSKIEMEIHFKHLFGSISHDTFF